MKYKPAWLLRLPVLLGIVFSLAIVSAIYLLMHTFQKPPHLKKIVQQLTMIQTPPLPPPPPLEQTPQAPELKEEQLEAEIPEKEPEPAPKQVDAPPAGELGLDADGVAGADGFGLAGHKGGQSILGGNGGSAMMWYGGQIKDQLEDGLQNLLADTPATRSGYNVLIEVWVGADGRINRCELTGGSGQAAVDQEIRNALVKLKLDVGKPPPENMPQPVKIRLISKA
jgi:TonB family protein